MLCNLSKLGECLNLGFGGLSEPGLKDFKGCKDGCIYPDFAASSIYPYIL